MSFKTSLFTLLVFCSGCGLRIGEKAPQDKPIVIGGAGFSCLSELSEKMDAFLGARMQEPEIRQFMSCIRYGFESFGRKTRGSEADSFSPSEIRDFLTEYFLKERSISDTLLNDMMVVKKTLIGGPIDKITRGDLVQAIETLKFFEDQAVKLNPYMDLYNFQIGRLWVMKEDNPTSRVDEAVTTLTEVATAVGHRLARAAHPYPIKSLESLLVEFRKFAGWEQIFTNARPPESWGKFVSAYKSMVIGDESPFVRPQDWAVLLSSSASIYGLHIKTKYARSKTSLLHGEGLEALIRTGDDLVDIANAAIDRHPKKYISFVQIDRLIDSLPEVGMMPEVATADPEKSRPLRATSLKGFVRALFDRVLGDDSVAWRSRRSEGLSRVNIGQMMAEFSLWTGIQRFLDRTFQPAERSKNDRLETLAERIGPVGASSELMQLMGAKDVSSEGMQVVRAIELQLRPLFRPDEDQVFLTELSELPKHRVVHGFHNLSIMNMVRGAIALLFRGYSSYKSGEGLFNKGMSEDEMQTFYMDIRDFGVDLGLFDPKSANSGIRAYREANMFTYTGNGILKKGREAKELKDYLTPTEAMEYLAFVYSGGNMGREIHQAMINQDRGLCLPSSRQPPISQHGNALIGRECFKQNLMKVMLPRLKPMPTMFAELSAAPADRKMQITEHLIDTVTSGPHSDSRYVDWHEITTLAMILHYTESVMTRYNSDGDNKLNTKEVWAAFETFENYLSMMISNKCGKKIEGWVGVKDPAEFENAISPWYRWWEGTKQFSVKSLTKLSCDRMPDSTTAAIFAFLVTNGRVPATLSELVFGLNRFPKWPILGVEFDVDRSALLKVFAALVKESAESPAQK